MARTSLQIIAESLAKRHGLTQKEAERFLATAFSVRHEGLDDDKQVKGKGLRTSNGASYTHLTRPTKLRVMQHIHRGAIINERTDRHRAC